MVDLYISPVAAEIASHRLTRSQATYLGRMALNLYAVDDCIVDDLPYRPLREVCTTLVFACIGVCVLRRRDASRN